jgi:phosphohistidine phosphatase
MKELYIVRHAKAENAENFLEDMERPLHTIGYQEANQMSICLAEKLKKPDLLLSSIAVRAYGTAQIFAKELGYPEKDVQVRKEIYNAPSENIKECIAALDDKHQKVILFGHNPGLSDLCLEIGDEMLGELPTCAVIGILFNLKHWSEILHIKGNTFLTMFPS